MVPAAARRMKYPLMVSILTELSGNQGRAQNLTSTTCDLFRDRSPLELEPIDTLQVHPASQIATRDGRGNYGYLSPFWAQEAIGAPEAIQFIQKWNQLQNAANRTGEVPIGIIDDGIDPRSIPSGRVISDFFESMQQDRCSGLETSRFRIIEPTKVNFHGNSVLNPMQAT